MLQGYNMYTTVTIQSLSTVEQALKNLRLFCFDGISMVFPVVLWILEHVF